MRRIRVLIVEDSLTVRAHLAEVLSRDEEIEVAGEAADGKRAIELCREIRPDVISLDMVLPKLSGLAVTEYVMAYCPTPILIVSASVNRGAVYKTYEALAAGALDVLEKPKGNESDFEWEKQFVQQIKTISQIKVITHLGGRRHPESYKESPVPVPRLAPYKLVALGASTGGPAAVMKILQDLPATFPLPLVVVIHIGEAFGQLLAEWLGGHSQLPVTCAVSGEALPEPGHARVILAPPDYHLLVVNNHLCLRHDSERHSCRPSVDVLFESVAKEMGAASIACLLTGMGKDGAQGLLAIRRAGGKTLAQDEESSAIFGMPKEAIRIGAAERVVGLSEIVPTLLQWTSGIGPRPL